MFGGKRAWKRKNQVHPEAGAGGEWEEKGVVLMLEDDPASKYQDRGYNPHTLLDVGNRTWDI